ncbi:hypothetical protein D1BOALGB6SA_5775 [Olavius sp. associated proteobacterium Delta 1]|nr:hypothetical protein D1BOALGB6SA_5775 [Olavius sp. associated proteobacterium Delta 1]
MLAEKMAGTIEYPATRIQNLPDQTLWVKLNLFYSASQ